MQSTLPDHAKNGKTQRCFINYSTAFCKPWKHQNLGRLPGAMGLTIQTKTQFCTGHHFDLGTYRATTPRQNPAPTSSMSGAKRDRKTLSPYLQGANLNSFLIRFLATTTTTILQLTMPGLWSVHHVFADCVHPKQIRYHMPLVKMFDCFQI